MVYFAVCLLLLLTAVLSVGNASESPFHHVTVAQEKGRFKAWPANGGLWQWGSEILVMYYDGTADFRDTKGHTVDMSQPLWTEQARSKDGGLTWTTEKNPLPHPTTKPPADLTEPINFQHPDLALCFKMTHWVYGASFLYYSYDRGKHWNGPYRLPLFGLESINARNCYLINSAKECLAFVSGGKTNNDEDGMETFAIRTQDGGKTWEKLARAGRPTPELGKDKTNFTIMPSVVRLDKKRLLCLTRCMNGAEKRFWIEAWRSEDDGATWTFASTIDTANTSTPPALVRLQDGTLVVTYGYRTKPFGIRARFSKDDGATWSHDVILRDDGGNFDLGYTRSLVRPDGKILTFYYFNTDPMSERRIEATLWDPKAVLKSLAD